MSAPIGNKNALGNEGGRPPMFSTPEEMDERVDEYFETGRETKRFYTDKGIPYDVPVFTITGLALFLGFSSRQSLCDYAEKIEFVDTIKRAKTRIEMKYEENLSFPGCTGSIFALKNMDWHDKTEMDHTSKGNEISIAPIQWVNGSNTDK